MKESWTNELVTRVKDALKNEEKQILEKRELLESELQSALNFNPPATP